MQKTSTTVEKAVADFLRHLRERNASPHTIKAYSGDLASFAAYAGSRGWRLIDHIAIRGFLSQLYEKGLGKTSVARSLAAVRSLYRWLAREGVVEQNPAKLVATPKLAKKLPRVPTIEEMNSVLDGPMPEAVAFPERDRLMLELLYGCGADAVAALADGGVGQADRVKMVLIALDAGAIDFHLNNVGIDAVDGGAESFV